MKSILKVLACGSALVLSAMPAAAQGTWEGRGWISVNGGYQGTTNDFASRRTFTVYAEDGTFEAAYPIKAAPLFDVGGGARVWRNLGVGVSVSGYTKKNASDLSGRIPHPFFFNQFREVEGSSSPLTREEVGVHIQAMWMVPVSNRISVGVFGGPSYFNVKQELVNDIEFDESYPYDSASLSGVATSTSTKGNIGFNVGADVMYMLTSRFGVGGVVRFSRAKIDFEAGGESLTLDVGGAQAGGGIRLRF